MEIRKVVFSLLVSTLPFFSMAQDKLQLGFKMLETGQFLDAASFFKDYLVHVDSTDKTARLCYGRGVGLSGNPEKAKFVFRELQEDFNNDFEVDLNMAEAHMWSKDYDKALILYKDLAARDSDNFAALLGLANAYSENKNYTEALKYVEKALVLQPENNNALVSRKFVRLGNASILSNDGNFDEALNLYNAVLKENSIDVDAILNKGQVLVTAKRLKEAKQVYNKVVGIPEKKITGLLGLSSVANLQSETEIALQWAKQAVMYSDSSTKLAANLGLVNALGWNKKFDKGFQLLNKLSGIYPESTEILAAYGRLSIWSKNFENGATYFNSLLRKTPNSFDGNLGYADARHAQGMDKESYEYVRKTLDYYPGQRDALQFLERLQMAHDPTFSSHVFFSRDNGGNISQNYNLKATFDPHPQVRTFVLYNYRTAENTAVENGLGKLSINQMGAGMHYQWKPFLKIGGQATVLSTATKNHVIGELVTFWNVGRFQKMEAKFNQELQTFTADLIDRNLRMDNLTLNYNLSLPSKIGLYSQLIHTKITDGNTRNLIFASLYYDFKQSPVLKAGVNTSIFSFKNQVPSVYFSPEIFKGYELFAAAENTNETTAKWLYQATVATGFQKISQESLQGIYRFDIKTGWRFNQRLWALGYFMRSNSAASSVQGFTYNEWGFKVKYIFPARLL
ncbi:MAG: tetratricopeptide (TPR) repeat protein [Spirosomataceae bacterium]|jgi:tetratricopeptide (TPR) repeat protein